MSSWHQGKLFIEHALTISHDSLHVIVGVMIQLALALLIRRPISAWMPWLWVLAIILWSETVDLWTERWPDAGMQYGEAAKDLLLTMLLPTLLMAAARLRPDIFRGSQKRKRR